MDLEQIWYGGWPGMVRTALIGLAAYVTLVLLLRVSGNRTLSKMNAFDLVVTVSLGSTLATILLNKNVALAEGAVALAMLIGLQFLVTFSSVRTSWVRRVVTGEPRCLYANGRLLDKELVRARITKEEVLAAVRAVGLGSFDAVEAVVFETDGSFSVIKKDSAKGHSTLEGVKGI